MSKPAASHAPSTIGGATIPVASTRSRAKSAAIVATLVALLGLAVGCGSEDIDENRPLRVQVFTGAYSSMPVHVAVEKGFFQQHGLEVERLPANSSSAAIAALIGGSMDVVESAPDLVLANIDKGIDLKYLVGNESTNYVTLVVGNHVPLSEHGRDAIVRQLAGRRIGVNAIGSTVYLAAVLMLEEAGLAVDDVDFVATGSAATTLSSWQTGAVDAQMTFAPVPELLEILGLARPALVLADDGPPALKYRGLYAGWVASGEWIDNRPARADAFIAAIRDAIDWIREPGNHAEMLELATRYAPVGALSEAENEQVMDRMVRNYRRYWGYRISPEAIDLWNAYALRFDLIGERIPFADVVHARAPTCTGACP